MLVEHPSPELDKHLHAIRHIAPIMEAIFNLPVLLIQGQQTLDIGFLSRQIGKPIHDLLMLFLTFLHVPPDCEDLCNPSPLSLKPLVYLGTGPDLSHFQSPMALLHFSVRVPFTPVELLV